jgi:hypothetical protein
MNPTPPPAAEGSAAADPGAPRRLSLEFQEILRETAGRAVTLGELEERLKGRGFALFILILSVPFCIPVSLPGLSVAFGFVIVLIGMRIFLGRRPKLPGFILAREIQHATLERIVRLGVAVCVRIERWARPRMDFLRRSPMAVRFIGLGLVSGGVQLLLPLPPLIPLSNTIPAVSIVLLTAGMIERDGVLVLCGYAVNALAWLYFAICFAMAGKGLGYLWEAFQG